MQKKSDLKNKNLELVTHLKADKEKFDKYEKVKELYKESSAELKLCVARCKNLNLQNQLATPPPKAVQSKKCVTISKATYTEYDLRLKNA